MEGGGVSDSDAEYFQLRAEQEIERVRMATKPEVVAVHYTLAELYLERLATMRQSAIDEREQ